MKTKICTQCGKKLPATTKYFHKDTCKKDGLRPDCKNCHHKISEQYSQSQNGIIKRKQYYQTHRKKILAINKQYNQLEKNKISTRKAAYKRKFGITLEQYDKMFEAQNGVCVVCGLPETTICKGVVRRLCVDHDHKTGEIRGLLCGNCNRAIGGAKEKICVLLKMVEYLKGYNNIK